MVSHALALLEDYMAYVAYATDALGHEDLFFESGVVRDGFFLSFFKGIKLHD